MRRSDLFLRPALLALGLSAACALAGCGVKGPLEPPPGVTVAPGPINPATLPPSAQGQDRIVDAAKNQGGGSSSRPVLQAPASQNRNPLDWLID